MFTFLNRGIPGYCGAEKQSWPSDVQRDLVQAQDRAEEVLLACG